MSSNQDLTFAEKNRLRQQRTRFAFLLPLLVILGYSPLTQCTGGGAGGDGGPTYTQYYNKGEDLYLTHCSNCHQVDGTGLAQLYPPLHRSDYMAAHFEEVICLIRYGKSGEIVVNGIMYNQPMKGIPTLTDLEIAEIATYIYNTWGNKKGLIDVRQVSDILKRCESEGS